MKKCTLDIVKRIANNFRKHPPIPGWRHLSRCEIAQGQCKLVSQELAERLKKHGCKTKLLHVHHHKFRVKHPVCDCHFMLQFEKYAIDLTGAQYRTSWGGVRIVPIEQIRKEWKERRGDKEEWW